MSLGGGTNRSREAVPLLASIVAAICWAIGGVLTKHLLIVADPVSLLFAQLLVSVACLSPFALFAVRVPHGAAWRMALPGVLQPGLSTLLAFAGLRHIPVGIETTLFAPETPFTLLLACVFLRERPARYVLLFSALASCGAALLSVGPHPGMDRITWFGAQTIVGSLLVIVAVVLAALSAVASRAVVSQGSPLQVVTMSQIAALLTVVPVVWLSHAPLRELVATANVTIEVVAAGLTLQAVPFLLFTVVLARTTAGFAALFVPLIPLLTVALAAIFLGETLSPLQAAGVLVVLAASVAAVIQQLRTGPASA